MLISIPLAQVFRSTGSRLWLKARTTLAFYIIWARVSGSFGVKLRDIPKKISIAKGYYELFRFLNALAFSSISSGCHLSNFSKDGSSSSQEKIHCNARFSHTLSELPTKKDNIIILVDRFTESDERLKNNPGKLYSTGK